MQTMWQLKLNVIFIGLILINKSVFSVYLKTEDRSDDIRSLIDEQFNEARKGSYKFNGTKETEYGSNNFLYSFDLVKSIIKYNKNQKDFNIIDIGAGQGGFGKGLCKYLKEQVDLPKDISVNIIGVTAEHMYDEDGLCIRYLTGNTNAENFNASLDKVSKKFSLDIKNKIDLAISQYTFIHLVDQLGTLVDVFNNLRPRTGMMFLDHFYVPASLGIGDAISAKEIFQILPLSNVQFLIQQYDGGGAMYSYLLIHRINTEEMKMPFTYGKPEEFQNFSSASFIRATYNIDPEVIVKPLKPFFLTTRNKFKVEVLGSENSEELYNWLRQNTELSKTSSKWESIFKDL